MSSARRRPLGLRTRLMLWWGLVLAGTMAAGFLWVHFGLVRVLESRNDAFLDARRPSCWRSSATSGPAAGKSSPPR